jgi:hypothetical protein
LSPPPADLRVCAATRGTQVLTDGTTQSAATTLSRVTSRLVAVGMLGAAVASSAALSSTARDRASAAGQFCSSGVRGDFDRDRRADVARVGSARRGCDRRWTLVVRLGAGGSVARSLDRDRAQLEARRLCQGVKCTAFGAHDIDGDGRDELEVADETPATGGAVVVYGLARGWIRPLKPLRRGGRERELMTFFYLGSANGAPGLCAANEPRAGSLSRSTRCMRRRRTAGPTSTRPHMPSRAECSAFSQRAHTRVGRIAFGRPCRCQVVDVE